MAEREFRTLLAAHVAGDPAEATLVLAAAAAFEGLAANGDVMASAGGPSSLRAIAAELDLHVGAVRRGVRALIAAGLVRFDAAGVHVQQAALATRWAARSAVIRLSADVRALGLRSEPLLVAGVVAGEMDRQGRLVAGIGRWCARTGLARRTVQRALAAAEAAGAIHRWVIPGRWLLCCAPGPRRKEAQEMKREAAQEMPPSPPPSREVAQEMEREGGRETAHPPVAKWRAERREAAHPPSQSGARIPGSDRSTEQPPDARARARGADRDRDMPAPKSDTAGPDGSGVIDWDVEEGNLRRILLRTTLRERVPPMPRLQFIIRLAAALRGERMLASECDRLWGLAQARTKQGDAGGLFATWLGGGAWREVLDETAAKDRAAAARARGAAARAADEGDAGRDPRAIGDVLKDVLRNVRQA